MSNTKLKELHNLKENFKQIIIENGPGELDITNPIVEMIAIFDVGPKEKYSAFDFAEMLKENYMNNKQKLLRCLEVLSTYGIDLLRREYDRAPGWHTIRVPPEISCITGSVTVLLLFGYCESSNRVYVFPSGFQPNETDVRKITMELVISRKELVLAPTRLHKFVSDKINENALKEAAIVTPTKQLYTEPVLSMHMPTGMSASAEPVQPMTWESMVTPLSYTVPVQQGHWSALPPSLAVTRVVSSYQKTEQQLPRSLQNLNLSPTVSSGVHSAPPSISENVKNNGTMECDICGTSVATMTCSECDNKMTCQECDVKWHGHFKRRNHSRRALVLSGASFVPPVGSPKTPLQVETSRSMDLKLLAPVTQSNSSESDDIEQVLAQAKFPPSYPISSHTLVDRLLTPLSSAKVSPVNSKVPVVSAVVTAAKVEPNMPALAAAGSSFEPNMLALSAASSSFGPNMPALAAAGSSFEPNMLALSAAGSSFEPNMLALSAASSSFGPNMPALAAAGSSFGPEVGKRFKWDEKFENNWHHVASLSAGIVPREPKSPVSVERVASASSGMFPVGQQISAVTAASSYKSKVVQMQEEAHSRFMQEQKFRMESNSHQLKQHHQLHNEDESKQQLPNVSLQSPADQSRLYMFSSEPVEKTLELIQKKKEEAELMNNYRVILRALKMAEGKGYNKDIRTILRHSQGKGDPVAYMSDVWSKKVNDVIKLSRPNVNFNEECNPSVLAHSCLSECDGDVERAVALFITNWNKKVDEIMQYCAMSHSEENRKLVVNELSACNGDGEECLTRLIKRKFVQNIFAQPASEPSNGDGIEITTHLNEQLTEILKDTLQDRERQVRMILCEANLQGWQRSSNVITLLHEIDGTQLVDVVEAARSQGTIDKCRQFLKRECECAICYSMYPLTQMRSLPACQCRVCVDCLRGHFEVVIRERFIRNMVCPVCSLPDIDNSEQTEAYFDILLIMFRVILPEDVYELFQVKLRDWNLMMDPSFRWCAYPNCRFGFIVESDQKKVVCPSCQKPMCQHCKKVWESQHEGLSCEDFQSWKEANDPELQAMGLARHLEENGIECPHCKCRYSLAKGGCMHFTCYQCRHEFCSGCLEDFKRGKKCKKFKSCAKAGLHCHHPRDCLFYLRDRDVEELQKLLTDRQVPFDSRGNIEAKEPGLCSVMEQKQTQNGFKDEPCGKAVTEYSAGLCDVHYREYLVGLINRHGIDPAEVMVERELVLLLEKSEKLVPKRAQKQSDVDYRKQLLQCVIKELPLPDRSRRQVPTTTPAAAAAAAANVPLGEDIMDSDCNT